jgi:hypothetical protein
MRICSISPKISTSFCGSCSLMAISESFDHRAASFIRPRVEIAVSDKRKNTTFTNTYSWGGPSGVESPASVT